jgi:hypothetical protein
MRILSGEGNLTGRGQSGLTTYEGQRNFASDRDRDCSECAHFIDAKTAWANKRTIRKLKDGEGVCEAYIEVMGKVGASFPGTAAACKYFVEKDLS